MSNKAKYIIYSVLEYALTFGGTGAVIVYNYVQPDTSLGYKLSFTGIVLIFVIVLVAKAMFEHSYQDKMNDLLQALASATDNSVKEELNNEIERLKVSNEIYQKITTLLPIAMMLAVCYLAIDYLTELTDVLEAILLALGGGGLFGVLKVPLGDKAAEERAQKKVNKYLNKQ